MPVSPLPQAPHRQERKVFLTPLIGDVLFSEVRDCNRILIPEYGTPHPDTNKWPDHKLVYVKTVDIERDGIFEFFYAANRENQDLYNFEFKDSDFGGRDGTKYPTVIRSYVTLRENWVQDNDPNGTLMDNIPADKFSGEYVLSQNLQGRIGEQELDGLFVVEKKTFVKRSALSEVRIDPLSGRSKRTDVNLYYRGELVSGTAIEELADDPSNDYWGIQSDGVFRELEQLTEDWFSVIESSVLPADPVNSVSNPARIRIENRVTPLGTDILFTEIGVMPSPVPAYGSSHYSMPSHKLSFIEPADATGKLYKFTYIADRPNQDDYNFEYTDADIGGQKFKAVVRTYITPRKDWKSTGSGNGDVMPIGSVGGFDGTYVQSSNIQTRIGEPELDNLYVVEKKTYIKRVPMYQNDYDEVFGGILQTKQEIYHREEKVGGTEVSQLFEDKENAYWGLQDDFIYREGIQLTQDWFAISEKQVVPDDFGDNMGNKKERKYTTSIEYAWPAVLIPVQDEDRTAGGRLDAWERLDTNTDYIWWVRFSKEAFRGPCKAEVTETFTIAKPPNADFEPPLTLLPTPISITNPFYSLNIGPTLHPDLLFRAGVGTTDPVYEYQYKDYDYPATNEIDWPDKLLAANEIRPFRGGWLQTKTEIFSPKLVP